MRVERVEIVANPKVSESYLERLVVALQKKGVEVDQVRLVFASELVRLHAREAGALAVLVEDIALVDVEVEQERERLDRGR